MNLFNRTNLVVVIAALGGVLIGAFWFSADVPRESNSEAVPEQAKVLYWVAPMDDNYRRDEPGLSPMGMELIPVYEQGEKAADSSPGTITISPDVINNLGVRTGVALRKSLQSQIVTVGYVQYDQDKLIHIHPRISGWVEKLDVKATGDPVVKNQPLYSLYSPELVSAQEDVLLAISRKDTRLVEASKSRLRALKIPESFIKELQRTRKIHQTVTFYSPQNGVVDNLNIREGFFVQPGTTMMSIGSLAQVWVEAEIFARQAALVHVNDAVSIALDYLPGRTWSGKVDYIYPTLDKENRTVRLRIRIENEDAALKPNMYAQVTVYSESDTQQLVIPREALIRTGSQDRVVLDLGDGRFKSVEVKVGRLDAVSAEILDGLAEGERIVTSAQFLLDSESSKTSDFKRMHHGDAQAKTLQLEEETSND